MNFLEILIRVLITELLKSDPQNTRFWNKVKDDEHHILSDCSKTGKNKQKYIDLLTILIIKRVKFILQTEHEDIYEHFRELTRNKDNFLRELKRGILLNHLADIFGVILNFQINATNFMKAEPQDENKRDICIPFFFSDKSFQIFDQEIFNNLMKPKPKHSAPTLEELGLSLSDTTDSSESDNESTKTPTRKRKAEHCKEDKRSETGEKPPKIHTAETLETLQSHLSLPTEADDIRMRFKQLDSWFTKLKEHMTQFEDNVFNKWQECQGCGIHCPFGKNRQLKQKRGAKKKHPPPSK